MLRYLFIFKVLLTPMIDPSKSHSWFITKATKQSGTITVKCNRPIHTT